MKRKIFAYLYTSSYHLVAVYQSLDGREEKRRERRGRKEGEKERK